MDTLDHLAIALWGLPPALMQVGREDAALQVLRRAMRLDDREAIEDLVVLLGGLSVELAHAHGRARRFTQRAPRSIYQDAIKYEQDVFLARCWVSAARAAAKQALRGEAWLPS